MNPYWLNTQDTLGRTKKIQNDKYRPYEMKILIMYHVHGLTTEMEGEPTNVPKCTPENTNQVSPIV